MSDIHLAVVVAMFLTLVLVLVFGVIVAALVAAWQGERWRLVASGLKLDQAALILGVSEAVRLKLAETIEHAVDESIGRRLPTAEQFEASVKAMMTAREQHANGRDSGDGRS